MCVISFSVSAGSVACPPPEAGAGVSVRSPKCSFAPAEAAPAEWYLKSVQDCECP